MSFEHSILIPSLKRNYSHFCSALTVGSQHPLVDKSASYDVQSRINVTTMNVSGRSMEQQTAQDDVWHLRPADQIPRYYYKCTGIHKGATSLNLLQSIRASTSTTLPGKLKVLQQLCAEQKQYIRFLLPQSPTQIYPCVSVLYESFLCECFWFCFVLHSLPLVSYWKNWFAVLKYISQTCAVQGTKSNLQKCWWANTRYVRWKFGGNVCTDLHKTSRIFLFDEMEQP